MSELTLAGSSPVCPIHYSVRLLCFSITWEGWLSATGTDKRKRVHLKLVITSSGRFILTEVIWRVSMSTTLKVAHI